MRGNRRAPRADRSDGLNRHAVAAGRAVCREFLRAAANDSPVSGTVSTRHHENTQHGACGRAGMVAAQPYRRLEGTMRTYPLRSLLLLTVVGAGLMTGPVLAGQQREAGARSYQQFTAYFELRADEYVALHRRLERLVAKETLF